MVILDFIHFIVVLHMQAPIYRNTTPTLKYTEQLLATDHWARCQGGCPVGACRGKTCLITH